MLTELKNRGAEDVLIVCCDGLKGLPEAIEATWPQATVQTCVIHLLRGSFRYAGNDHKKKIAAQLRPVYTAASVEAAEKAFSEFENGLGKKYPAIVRLWRDQWETFVPFLAFPAEVRRVVYTTDVIVNPCLRFLLLPVGDHHLIGTFGVFDQISILSSVVLVVVVVAGSPFRYLAGISGGQFEFPSLVGVETGSGKRVASSLATRCHQSTVIFRAVATTATWNPRRLLILR